MRWVIGRLALAVFVHDGSISNPFKIVNNWFCSHLLYGLLKFQEHIGKYALSERERLNTSDDFGSLAVQGFEIPVSLYVKTDSEGSSYIPL